MIAFATFDSETLDLLQAAIARISQTTLRAAIYDHALFFYFQRTPTGARLHPAWGWMFGRYLMVIWWKVSGGPRGCQAAECSAAQAAA